ncbi:MAG TPA: hypothetical protein VJQ56_13945 [Blastocatellia bacterium]|nr:hypothetical protein [Blastocatellia bacterium]
MEQALTWLVVLIVIALMFWSLMRENSRMKGRTSQEYERDLARTHKSMMRAGMMELDRLVGNERDKRAAVEYIQDEQGRMTRTGGKSDDAERTEGNE